MKEGTHNTLVIHEMDLDDEEKTVIGLADSIENAEAVISTYYGEYKEISFRDIRDSMLEYEKVLEIKDHLNEPYRVKVWLEWFEINGF